LGMILIQALLAYVKDRKIVVYLNLCWFLFAMTLFATLSTTAFVLWPLGTLVLMVFVGSTHAGYALKRAAILASVVAIVFATSNIPIIDVINDRTLTRFVDSEVGILEDFNDAIIHFLEEKPVYILFGTGLGNVHLFADSYLHPIVAEYASGTAFVAKMGWLRILSETGIFSLLLFVAWIFKLSMSVKSRCRLADYTNIGKIARALLLTYGFCYLLVGGYVSGIFMFSAGLSISLYSIMRERQIAFHHLLKR